jgi:exopolysaccharide production protein ExoY
MKNKSLVSQSRQRTKGGSLPGSRSSRDECRISDRFIAEENPPTPASERSPSSNGEARGQGVSILLEKTILQLFGAGNGNEKMAGQSSNGSLELRPTTEIPGAHSSCASRAAVQEPCTESVAAAFPGRFPLWKRLLDLLLVLLTMCIWLPLMVLTMCLIKVASPGPAFYRQRRIGFRGRPFMIFKFRSMKVNAETQTHEEYVEKLIQTESPLTKLDADDPRLISFGRFLRSTGLDELPQLFNVLRGEMSLVGPRPCTEREFGCFLPWQKARVQAPPGLTGYWQVNGKNKTTFNQMMRMDLHYAREMSLWLDLSIICKTFPAIVEQTLDSITRRRSSQPGAEKLIAVYPSGHNGSAERT